MSENWEDMTPEEKQYFIKIVNERYPEFLLNLTDIFIPFIEAIQPIIDAFAKLSEIIWQKILEKFSIEEIKKMIEEHGPSTSSKTTDSKK